MKTCYCLELDWNNRVVVREPLGMQDYEVHYEGRYKHRFLPKANSLLFKSESFKDCMVFALKHAADLVEKDFK